MKKNILLNKNQEEAKNNSNSNVIKVEIDKRLDQLKIEIQKLDLEIY